MTLYSKIAERIKKQIKLGILKPGEMLPNEIEFAERLSVTRNTLRRTLQVLEKENLITRRKKAGTYIAENVLDILKSDFNIVVAADFRTMENQSLFLNRLDDDRSSMEASIAVHKLLGDNTVVRMFSTSSENMNIPEADGYLIIDSMRSVSFVKILADRKLPHICFETHIQYPGVNTVMGDDEGAAYICTKKLIEEGHRKIAFVGGLLKEPELNTGIRRRTEGYKRAFSEAGLNIDETIIFNDFRMTNYESFKTEDMTSVFLRNTDKMSSAVCAIAETAFMLKNVPQEYKLPFLCVDRSSHNFSQEEQELMNSFPGCIKPREKIAEEGIKRLFEWIANPDFRPQCFKVDFENNFQSAGIK
ncbi:MAG: hypothetical protein A2017_13830 [Lentisphaerae bacterium GWF2_44_16]|nr:MAG: hypothetical protein A2017_13830 [Lentisphaerae bacterium GWF2_44_16]